MERVERAILDNRCVLVFGGRALQDPEVLGELRRRALVPAVALSGDAKAPAVNVSADALSAALNKEGGLLCLIEVESEDSVGLGALAALVQASPHKPRMVVVARAFNPFALPSTLRMLKFDHEKKKAREFLFPLPVLAAPAAPVAAAVAEEPKKKTSGAPKASFVGRTEELEQLNGFLEAGGPLVISGPAGVGKRWLIERALADRSFRRLPDFSLAFGAETDSLYARLALLLAEAGDKRLGDALRDPNNRPVPAELAALAVSSLQNPALDNTLLVIDHLEHALRGDGTFHREGRLEILLKALLLARCKMRIVFLSTLRTRFYREGEGVHLPVMELAGLKGKDLHSVFESYRVENFPREHFGDIINRIHGHAFAARMFAIAVREPEHRDELVENRRFFQMENVAHLDPVARRIAKALENLPEEERKALSTLAHFRLPFSSADMEQFGVDRKIRLSLLAKGLLDQTPDEVKERSFSVHALVLAHLDMRERSDFELLERLGGWYLEKAAKAETFQKQAWSQEGNRFLFESHRVRNRARMPYPDNDPALESLRGMIRGRKPRLDLAEQRLNEIASIDPANTEIQLLIAELRIALRAPPEAIASVYHEAQQRAPTPEVFHAEATWHQYKPSGRSRAATALERGIAVFGESGRMRRRLAGIYLDQNRNDDAIAQLQEAMRLEPMMPDTYGILGELYLIRGAFEQAEQSLEEARRLDPENGLHMARLGALLIELGQPDRQIQAEQLLEGAIQKDKRNYLAHLYLALIVLSRADGDLERADWLLKQASKMDERAARPLAERARIAVRRKNWVEASSLLDKAQKLEPSCHEAWYARGELFEAQGLIFNANPTYLRALELSPKGSKARSLYETAVQRTAELITSGAAVEMQKQAEEAGLLAPAPQPKGGAQRTVRRRREQGNHAEVSGSDAVANGSANVEENQDTAAADPAETVSEAVTEAAAEALAEAPAEAAAE